MSLWRLQTCLYSHRYRVRYTDSIDIQVNQTEIATDSTLEEREAKEILKEQLNENGIYPDWIEVIDIKRI